MGTENLSSKLTDKLRTEQFKREIRSSIKSRADLFQAHLSAFNVERLNENLISYLAQQSGTWAAFRGCDHEPRLDKVIQKSQHLKWVFPRCTADQLVFVRSQKFSTGRFGMEEPVGEDIISAGELAGFLVPGLSFDRQGVRLGRGKGFYDKALAGTSGKRVGVCFSFQIFEGLLPCEPFDMRMDVVISEQGTYHVNGI